MGGTSEGKGSDIALSRDECFDLLSNHRRRYVLHYLRQNGGKTSLGKLADTVAARENDVRPDAVSYDQRKRVYTSLQQVHLPRMDEMQVVEFDEREGAVTIGPAAEDLGVYLEVVERREIPWSLIYFLLALGNGGAVGAAILGVPLLSAIPLLGWAMFVVMTFLVTSLVHVYLSRETRAGEGEPFDIPE